MTPRRFWNVIIVAAMPPPIHGQSVATAALVDELLISGIDLRLVDTSPGTLVRSWRYHIRRFFRVTGATAIILRQRTASVHQIYTVVESGLGQIYNIVLVLAARARGMTIFLHHHTRRHLETRSNVFGFLCQVAGQRGVHIVGSPRMEADLLSAYGTVQRTMVLHNAWLIEVPATAPTRMHRACSTLRLGHLSNLSQEKGLDLVLETVIAACDRGLDVRLTLGGPAVTSSARAKIERARAALGDRLEVLGPLSGREKANFFESCDVFLFPSTYKNETHGLVLAEAMSFGVPSITLDTGYIGEFVEDCGIVVGRPQDFVEQSVAQISEWIENSGDLSALAAKCRARFTELRHIANRELRELIASFREGPTGESEEIAPSGGQTFL